VEILHRKNIANNHFHHSSFTVHLTHFSTACRRKMACVTSMLSFSDNWHRLGASTDSSHWPALFAGPELFCPPATLAYPCFVRGIGAPRPLAAVGCLTSSVLVDRMCSTPVKEIQEPMLAMSEQFAIGKFLFLRPDRLPLVWLYRTQGEAVQKTTS
jgi:hypothetical protein